MNKIDKYLKKLTAEERAAVLEVLTKIKKGDLSGLDIKKLKGYDNYFRVRKGKSRILFHLDIQGEVVIQRIVRRNDTTY